MADRPRNLSVPHRYALVAAAEVITSPNIARPVVNGGGMLDWQERAWQFFDNVGEFRFGVGWTSNALSRVNLVAARPPRQVGDEPGAIAMDDAELTAGEKRASELVEMIAGGASGQGQLMGEFGEHLSVAGFGWLLAEPDLEDPNSDAYLTWNVYAQDALRFVGSGEQQSIEIRVGDGTSAEAFRKVHPNALIVKVWRKHPRRPWEPDAPVRGVLGVLEIIELLTDHVTASGRSRLAGAGILAIPSEAEFPPPPIQVDDDGEPDLTTEQDRFDNFVEELTKAMTVPIKDRDSASSVVPLPLSIPGEFVDKLTHITFSTPFDDRVSELLQESIKRLALGLDMPPEVLTGMAGVNHWTAWQVEETAITLHIEPNAEIVCNALTEGWLKPALIAEGFDPSAAMVWYDTSDLTSPPDKSGNAKDLYDRLQLSAKALRRETGFAEEDAPDEEEFKQRVLLDAAKGAPTLAPAMLAEAGILEPAIADAAEDAEAVDQGAAPQPGTDTPAAGPPPAEGRPGQSEAALLMACDGVVDRALEVAGKRLLAAVGRKTGEGPQAVQKTGDARVLHTTYDATVYADLDALLAGAFDRVPALAEFLDVDGDALAASLNAYCRGLLAAGFEHNLLRLSGGLADVTV